MEYPQGKGAGLPLCCVKHKGHTKHWASPSAQTAWRCALPNQRGLKGIYKSWTSLAQQPRMWHARHKVKNKLNLNTRVKSRGETLPLEKLCTRHCNGTLRKAVQSRGSSDVYREKRPYRGHEEKISSAQSWKVLLLNNDTNILQTQTNNRCYSWTLLHKTQKRRLVLIASLECQRAVNSLASAGTYEVAGILSGPQQV